MEKIMFVKNGNLDEVNNLLAKGWKVKFIQRLIKPMEIYEADAGDCKKDIYSYVVIEK